MENTCVQKVQRTVDIKKKKILLAFELWPNFRGHYGARFSFKGDIVYVCVGGNLGKLDLGGAEDQIHFSLLPFYVL